MEFDIYYLLERKVVRFPSRKLNPKLGTVQHLFLYVSAELYEKFSGEVSIRNGCL